MWHEGVDLPAVYAGAAPGAPMRTVDSRWETSRWPRVAGRLDELRSEFPGEPLEYARELRRQRQRVLRVLREWEPVSPSDQRLAHVTELAAIELALWELRPAVAASQLRPGSAAHAIVTAAAFGQPGAAPPAVDDGDEPEVAGGAAAPPDWIGYVSGLAVAPGPATVIPPFEIVVEEDGMDDNDGQDGGDEGIDEPPAATDGLDLGGDTLSLEGWNPGLRDRAVEDLLEAGLIVERFPGRFELTPFGRSVRALLTNEPDASPDL